MACPLSEIMTTMDKSLILLLQVIRSEGSIDPLLSAGLEYVQIAQLLAQAKQDGYVLLSEDKLVLSEEGNSFSVTAQSKTLLQVVGFDHWTNTVSTRWIKTKFICLKVLRIDRLILGCFTSPRHFYPKGG